MDLSEFDHSCRRVTMDFLFFGRAASLTRCYELKQGTGSYIYIGETYGVKDYNSLAESRMVTRARPRPLARDASAYSQLQTACSVSSPKKMRRIAGRGVIKVCMVLACVYARGRT